MGIWKVTMEQVFPTLVQQYIILYRYHILRYNGVGISYSSTTYVDGEGRRVEWLQWSRYFLLQYNLDISDSSLLVTLQWSRYFLLQYNSCCKKLQRNIQVTMEQVFPTLVQLIIQIRIFAIHNVTMEQVFPTLVQRLTSYYTISHQMLQWSRYFLLQYNIPKQEINNGCYNGVGISYSSTTFDYIKEK